MIRNESRRDKIKEVIRLDDIRLKMIGQEKITHLAFFHVHVHQQLMAVRTLIRTYLIAAS